MDPTAGSLSNTLWLFLGLIALVIGVGFFCPTDKPKFKPQPEPFQFPTSRTRPMTKKVTGVGIESETTLASAFILENLISEKSLTYTELTLLLKGHDKFKAKLIQYKVDPKERTFLYEFSDGSLFQVIENIAEQSRSYTERKP